MLREPGHRVWLIVAGLGLLSVLYVAGYGPHTIGIEMYCSGTLPEWQKPIVRLSHRIYWPMNWTYDRSELVRDFTRWYVPLWR